MMKRLFSLLIVTVFLTAGSVHAADEVVFVDLQEIFKQFYKTQLAQDQFRQQIDDMNVEVGEMETEIESLKEEIEVLRADSRDETLTEEIRANKRDLLEEKLVDLQKKEQEKAEFGKLRQSQLESQNQRMTTKLFDEIYDKVNTYAKMQGYAAVIDRASKSRMGTDAVLFASAKFDITAEIIEALNEGRMLESEDEEPVLNTEE